MQAVRKTLRRSVRLEKAEHTKLKKWAGRFHKGIEACEAFAAGTSFHIRTLDDIILRGTGREDTIERVREILKTA